MHRRLGNRDEAVDFLTRAVRDDPKSRENRHHLALSYATAGRFVDAAKELAVGMTQARGGAKIGAEEDFQLLSTVLSALGHWDLLSDVLRVCLDGACSLGGAGAQYPAWKVHLEYAVALQNSPRNKQSKSAKEESTRMGQRHAEEARKLSGMDPEQLQQAINKYVQISNQNGRAALLNLPDEYKVESAHQQQATLERIKDELSKSFAPLLSIAAATPPWSIAEARHLRAFDWPIPEDLAKQMRNDLAQQRAAFQEWKDGSGGAEEEDMLRKVVPSFTCLTIPTYSLEDCIFASRVSSSLLARQLQSRSDAADVLSYNDFNRASFPPLSSGKPLKVGLFSGDVRPHPMLSLITAFLKHSHSIPDVSVTLYHASADPTTLDSLRPYVDEDVSCSRSTYTACLDHARRHRMQVWLETTGGTGEGIPALSASGPAPVGVLWAGFPGSMADPSHVQYIVTDRHTIPPDSGIAEAYPEKHLYVPGSWMISERPAETGPDENATREEMRRNHGIPSDAVVYSYFGRVWKVDDVAFGTWCEIIQRVPNSYLVMLDLRASSVTKDPFSSVETIRKAWKEFGLPSHRLIFLPPFRRGEHLSTVRALSDVALDTFIYGGGVTSYEALFAGKPLVHCSSGGKMMQRAGGSVLSAAGIAGDLIAEDEAEYMKIAVRLGTDQVYYKYVRGLLEDTIKGRGEAVLFRPEVGVHALVEGIRRVYEIWYKGQAPEDVFVDALPARPHSEVFISEGSKHTGEL